MTNGKRQCSDCRKAMGRAHRTLYSEVGPRHVWKRLCKSCYEKHQERSGNGPETLKEMFRF